jgi:hypothetical protein
LLPFSPLPSILRWPPPPLSPATTKMVAGGPVAAVWWPDHPECLMQQDKNRFSRSFTPINMMLSLLLVLCGVKPPLPPQPGPKIKPNQEHQTIEVNVTLWKCLLVSGAHHVATYRITKIHSHRCMEYGCYKETTSRYVLHLLTLTYFLTVVY